MIRWYSRLCLLHNRGGHYVTNFTSYLVLYMVDGACYRWEKGRKLYRCERVYRSMSSVVVVNYLGSSIAYSQFVLPFKINLPQNNTVLSFLVFVVTLSAWKFSIRLPKWNHLDDNLYVTWIYASGGHPVAQLLEALHYKLEGRGFDSRCCHSNFSLT
jgi:hypothetical protein